MEPFDLDTAPLMGSTLIEAGAGTGKTFTLAGIFLRLIVERGLGIDQILVVTYTKAATEELKTRIRDRLLTAKAAYGGRPGGDEFLDRLVGRTIDPALAQQRIEDALSEFDRAAIFTIHGFCQRLLQHFAFETGHMFQSELVQEQQALVQEAADDFWRRHISSAPYELAHYALGALKGPEHLAAVLIHYCRYPDVTVLPAPVKPVLKAVSPWRSAADRMVQLWAQEKDKILNLLLDPGLNARFYGKCESDPQQPGLSRRRIRLMALAGAMDLWNGKYPLFDKAERFSATYLDKATKKNHKCPQHAFFNTCQTAVSSHAQMVEQLAAYIRYLKLRMLADARERINQKKLRRNIMFFDDLLLRVREALEDRRGQVLTLAVRGQYKAALVDEFQDTDPLQYMIFQHLFSHAAGTLVMIGDPKQAIYSFRGADIFSYLKAAENAQASNTLTKNWRSTPTLVRAVNTIFEGRRRPFGFERITYKRAEAARTEPPDGSWPLKLWCLTRSEADTDEKPISQETAVATIAAAVAEEIVRLTSEPANNLEPSRIVVLTRTHKQSQIIKKALALKMIPAVLHSAGSVFDTTEAEALVRVMAAAATPHNPVAVRAALACDLLGVQAHEFHDGLQNPTEAWKTRWTAFVHDHRAWVRHGFYRMLRGLMARENVRARLLALPDGERRLTNLLHLAELLQHAETEHRLGPEGLIKWLVAQHQSMEKGGDEQQLRLESDALAVRIITMHKSKGLQFDVVFCPFIWSGVAEDDALAVFHDTTQAYRLTLAVGPDIAPEHRLQCRKEALAENLRMMYVALTRARLRCYMVWGRINNTEVSAPAYLLHAPKAETPDDDWISPLVRKMRTLDDAGMMSELQALSRRSEGSIVVEPLPGSTKSIYTSVEKRKELRDCRILNRTIAGGWRIASFSSMAAGAAVNDVEQPDRDTALAAASQSIPAPEPYSSLFDFPRGVGAGLFFHDLLEHWDQTDTDTRRRQMLVNAKLRIHGFDQCWATAVEDMLVNLARTPLKGADECFCLAQVPMTHRINETEFYFPLQAVSAEALKSLFERHGGQTFGGRLGQRLGRLTFAPLQGFMKGFIDTIFRFGERYYLADWKSNYLGDRFVDYRVDALADTMVKDYYFLQYHLYVTALDLLLHQKVKNYDYSRHFGGVFYIFVRGIGPQRNENTGMFHDRPNPRLVEELKSLFMNP